MFVCWKFFTILFIAGLVGENFGYIQDTDDVIPSSKNLNSDVESGLQPPKGLQIAKGLGQARFKFLKNAKNLKLRLANKRNSLKGLLPSSQRGRQLPKNLNNFNTVDSENNKNGFDEIMESSKNNYFYQYPNMVGDRINKNDNNHNKNRMWSSSERSDEEEEDEGIFSHNIYQNSPTTTVRHNKPDNDDNFPKNWWENQDASHVVSPSSHFHNNKNNYHSALQSRNYEDENYNLNSNSEISAMNHFENGNSNTNKFSESNLQSAFGTQEEDGDIFEQIRKAAMAANAKQLKRNERHYRMDYDNEQNFRSSDENLQESQRNPGRSAYRSINAPVYNFQNAQPYVWYGFEGDKPYPLDWSSQRYRVPDNSQSMDELVGIHKKKLKKLKKHKLKKQRTSTDSDNMEHLDEDNRNVHPVIMQEYVQAIHGNPHISGSINSKNNFFPNQNEPLKIEMFENNSNSRATQNNQQDNEMQEDDTNQKTQLEHELNKGDFTVNMNMAEAMSLAAEKLARIEQRLENEKQQSIKDEQQMGKEVQKFNEDRTMQPSDPRIVMMALKNQNNENSMKEDPILTRYLLTDASKEWTNFRTLSEDLNKEQSSKKLNSNSKLLSNDLGRMIMRDNPDDNKNTVTLQRQINIPHSGVTVFEPTRIVHYHSSGPVVELANSGKIPVFEEPQTIIKVNTASDVEQPTTVSETQKSIPSPVVLSSIYDPSKMYAMRFGYEQNYPQIPVLYHQPAYRWPIVNSEPLTYTYKGVQYKFLDPRVPDNSDDPVLMSIGPQIPAHSSLLRPGNLFGLTRYNSGYGGPLGRLTYYQALLNKQQQQRQHFLEPHYNDYDYDNEASNKIETSVASEKKSPKLKESEEVHYITKRDVQQPNHDHQRHKRSTESETCPCFRYPFHGPPHFDPAYQSPAVTPYRHDHRNYYIDPRHYRSYENDPSMVGTPFTKILSKPYLGLWKPDHFRKPWLRLHEPFLHPSDDFHHPFHHHHQRNRFRRDDNEMPFFVNRNLLNNFESNMGKNDGLFYNGYHNAESGLDTMNMNTGYNSNFEQGN